MRIYAYAVFAETQAHHQVCRLAANTRQFDELLYGVWYLSPILLEQYLGGFFHTTRFRMVKPHRVNQFFNA
ncbi:MAG: hypothetical protein UY34_C0019G0048 [Parcubacteria group bacterium GW2011_GWA2_48_9]|nr:MAG: hypothetical protein UY34_C0019G0048 [Parcubacteria group bacterium GW2011_GWA2_48_9]